MTYQTLFETKKGKKAMSPKVSASPPVAEKATPAPKAKRPTTAPQPTRPAVDVAAVAEEQTRLHEAAESILEAMATGHQPTAGEWSVLRRVGPSESGNWTQLTARTDPKFDKWLKHRIAHLQRRSQLQTAAGSGKDRETAQKRLEAAQERLSIRGEEIADEMERLQQERLELERIERSAKANVDRQERAVKALMTMDSHFSPAILDEIRGLEQTRGKLLQPARQRKNELETIDRWLALDPLGDDHDHDYVVRACPEQWRDTVLPDPYHRCVSSPGWQAYISHHKARRAELERELAELESDGDVADLNARIQELRSTYIPV